MKHISFIAVCLLFFWGCKKEISPVTNNDYWTNLKEGLTDSLSLQTYHNLDFSRAVLNRVDSIDLLLVRIPLRGTAGNEDFVAVRTNRKGNIQRGKIVNLELSVTEDTTRSIHPRSVNGVIIFRSLQGKEELHSPVVNGYITAFHNVLFGRTNTEMVPGLMPEVIIVGYVHSGISFSTWCMVQTFIMDFGGGGSWGGYYASLEGGGGPSGGEGGPGGGGGYSGGIDPVINETILVDFESQDDRSSIDIEKFINCFNAIPDAGATCSIEIMADIPVDNDPNKIFNFSSNSPGHTFINIRKKNGMQSVSQNIGFYPRNGLKTILTNAPIDGKFVDNGNHEFNAGFIQNVTPEQLQHVLIKMQQDKNMKYDIDNFNCTDWALDVFNAAGAFQLDVPLYDIPGNYPSSGTRMPNGVYNKVREIKTSNPSQAANTDMSFLKAYAGNSTGPCN